MKLTCNLPEAEQEDSFRLFRGCLTADEEESARRLFPQYLFFCNSEPDESGLDFDQKPVRLCTCTCCRRSFEGVSANWARGKIHNEDVTCPYCGAKLTGKAIYKFKYDMPSLTSWIKTAVAYTSEDGALLVECGNLRRRFTWDELYGELDWFPFKRYYFAPGKAQMWHLRKFWEGCACVGHDWIPNETIREPFAPNLMGYADYEGDYAVLGLGEALEASRLRWCQIVPFYENQYSRGLGELATAKYMMKYLGCYTQYPQMEMAVKFGLLTAVEELVTRGKKNARYLDWSGRKPWDFLRMSKQDARLFLGAGMDFRELEVFRELGKGLTLKAFLELKEQAGSADNLRELAACAEKAGVNLTRALHYVQGLLPRCARLAPPLKTILSCWKDYLDMAQTLHYDMTEESVRLPKNLQERHDAAAAIIRHQASEKEMKRYKKRRRQLEQRYAYARDGLCILIPTSADEIVREGKTLHHCVGGYAARHIDGSTTILFLRNQRKPGRSFLTIELMEVKGRVAIRQIHGYRNEGYKNAVAPGKKYAWFLDPWLDWVNAGSPRTRDGLPCLPEETEQAAAN